MGKDVFLVIKNGIARITLQRSEKNNALTDEMINTTIKICDGLQWENINDVQICVIEAKGDFFCAGLDFEDILEKKELTKETLYDKAFKQVKLLRQMASLPFPLLSKVKGGALGLGLGFVAVSDYVIAEENSIFGTPEIKMGLPPIITTLYLQRKCGYFGALLFPLSGEVIQVKEAISIGLVNKCFSSDCFESESEKVENYFLEAGPNGLRKMKNILLKISPVPQSEIEEFSAIQLAEAFDSPEFKEGITAYKEKRSPNWVRKR